jgi:hypothetical protein
MLTWIGGEVSRGRRGCWPCVVAISGGLGSIPLALNINDDQLLFLKVVPTEQVSFWFHNILNYFV